jgi:hypothetical protein
VPEDLQLHRGRGTVSQGEKLQFVSDLITVTLYG